jgi:Fic family protein
MLLPFDAERFNGLTPDFDAWALRLDERILPRRWAGRLRRTIEAEATAASTSLEGVPVTVEDTLQILAGDPPDSVSPADRALVLGYRDAMTYVQRRADDGQLTWNRELLVAVQDRVLAGNFGAGAGRLRDGAAWIRNERSGEVVFEPPEPEQVPAFVDEVCSVVEHTDWHPAVTAAWVHVAIAAVHPFKDGNGRTARVLASLAMYRGGFKHPAFTNLEEWWGKRPDQYYAAFECLGSRFDRETAVTAFVRAHLRAQLAQVLTLALRQRVEGMLWTTLENLLEDHGIAPRLANALYDAAQDRAVTTGYYATLIDASAATARNDLQKAAAAGLLEAVGRTRGRRYVAGRRLFPVLARVLGVDEANPTAIVEELVRRADAADWTDPDTYAARENVQPQLPGLGGWVTPPR